jgi:hypothetical protein
MAGYEVIVGTELLPGLLNGPDGLARLVETVLNQVLEAQVTETLGRRDTNARTGGPVTETATGRGRSTREWGW